MFSRVSKSLAAGTAVCGLLGGAAASTAAGPPLPTAANGKTVQQVASGLQTTTSFAFGAGKVFAAEVPGSPPSPGGGVYVLKSGSATKLGSLVAAFGLAWHNDSLYVSGIGTTGTSELVRMGGWNGTSFTREKVLYRAPRRFTGFNGIGFGANGRLYVGVSLSQTGDHEPATTPYAYDLLSFRADGSGLKVVATGLRQPWQLVFPAGSSSPIVSVLGQDQPRGIKAPDFLVRVKPGQAYGFPSCNWVKVKACKGYAKPIQFFSPHTDIGGLALSGGRLYLTNFGFAAPTHPALVTSERLDRGPIKTVLSGFAPGQAVISVGIHGGWVYAGAVGLAGGATGVVYRVHL